jgi:Na+-translocating ferredoxin:NAD+ oxidoreductase RnfD subunit
MTTQQWQQWAWVSFAVSIVLTTAMFLCVFVFEAPGEVTAAIVLGGGMLFGFVTGFRAWRQAVRERRTTELRARHG